ncbi:MAG: hypothetical protein IPK72_05370 [Candidatus Eisenbacteria bacterium]|nr:hypothetical protein [Candidatus Eisenbacteria bacterium]
MKFNSIRRSTRFVLGTAALALSLAGCGDDDGQTNAPPVDQPTYDLNAAYGGLTATDEQPAFGDPTLAAMEEDEAPVSDPINDQVGEIGRGRATYAFTAIWGKLQEPERNDRGQLGMKTATPPTGPGRSSSPRARSTCGAPSPSSAVTSSVRVAIAACSSG